MIVYIIAAIALIAGLLYIYTQTADGWEDESGFHYGIKPQDPEV